MAQSVETADELFLAIAAVLRVIGERSLPTAFLDWMQRLQQYIQINGDYYKGASENMVGGIGFTR
jgi:hypothetical protein